MVTFKRIWNFISKNLLFIEGEKMGKKIVEFDSSLKPTKTLYTISPNWEENRMKNKFYFFGQKLPQTQQSYVQILNTFPLFYYFFIFYLVLFVSLTFFLDVHLFLFFTMVIVRDGNGMGQNQRMGSSSFVLSHPRPIPYDGKNFLASSLSHRAL